MRFPDQLASMGCLCILVGSVSLTSFVCRRRIPAPNNAYSFLNTIAYHFNEDSSTAAVAAAIAAAAASAATHSSNATAPAGGACLEHDHELLRPQLIGTWMPNGVGSMPGRRVIFAETQVSAGGQFSHLGCWNRCVFLLCYARASSRVTFRAGVVCRCRCADARL